MDHHELGGGEGGDDGVNHHHHNNHQNRRRAVEAVVEQPAAQPCLRCNSTNTKFCYYNNYSLSQPRYFCKACRRYWTHGGTLRNVPVGGGSRKSKRPKVSQSQPPHPPPQQNEQELLPTRTISPFFVGPHDDGLFSSGPNLGPTREIGSSSSTRDWNLTIEPGSDTRFWNVGANYSVNRPDPNNNNNDNPNQWPDFLAGGELGDS